EQGRVVRGGVVYAGGQAGDCFAMLCERSVPRRGTFLRLTPAMGDAFAVSLRLAADQGSAVVCDAESAADLRRVAALGQETGCLLCGSAGLARALAGLEEQFPGVPVFYARRLRPV